MITAACPWSNWLLSHIRQHQASQLARTFEHDKYEENNISAFNNTSPSCPTTIDSFWKQVRKNPEKGREAAAPSNIKEIQEVQGGQEAPHDGGAIIPKDA
jgi:hypothetical protein